jgi:hypothetical protein
MNRCSAAEAQLIAVTPLVELGEVYIHTTSSESASLALVWR